MTDAAPPSDPTTEEETGWATAKTLAEALPYIQVYDRETVVIKYGGHAMGEDEMARLFAADAVLLKLLGVHPVIVHGGGPQISRMLDRAGVKSTFVDGLRITDAATMEVADAHSAWGNLSHFADRPFPVEAIIPSVFCTRRTKRTVSRETPAHAVSMSEIEKGVWRASTASRTCFALAPRPLRTSPTRSSNSRYARSKAPQK